MSALVVVFAFLTLPQSFPDLPKDRVAALQKGEVVVATSVPEGSNAVFVVAEGVVEAPPARVWALVEACNNYSKTMPRIKESKELSRKGDVITCQITADMPFPLPNLTSVTRAEHTIGGGRYVRAFKLIEGDYHRNEGRWVIEPFDGDPQRTLARYELALEPKMPAPRSLVEAAQARTIPQLFKGLREGVRAPEATP
jgi:ribosome-associated toxin RatA of RatAB toxin-antitoxin module